MLGKTEDGVSWNDPAIDADEMNEMMLGSLIQKTSWGTGTKPLENHPKICNNTYMNKTIQCFSTTPAFIGALQGLQSFVIETGADLRYGI